MDSQELGGRLAFRYLRQKLHDRVGAGPTKDYLLKAPTEVIETAKELHRLIEEYNGIQADPDDTKWKAVTRLKSKLPQLPTIRQISDDVSSERQQSVWLENFLAAASTMDTAMSEAEKIREQHPSEDLMTLDLGAKALFFGLSSAHPKAKTRAFGWHAYEETVLQDKKLCEGKEFRKDEIIDALMEVLIDRHSEPGDPLYPLYRIMRDPESSEETTAALGWVRGYDNLSEELLHKAGY